MNFHGFREAAQCPPSIARGLTRPASLLGVLPRPLVAKTPGSRGPCSARQTVNRLLQTSPNIYTGSRNACRGKQRATLFDEPEEPPAPLPDAPLAERMRPRGLDEFVGQAQVIGEKSLLGTILRRAGKPPSLILWGPPGTGKTTLGRLIAGKSGSQFIALSAVFAGVREVRAAIEEARKNRRRDARTILFIDEIHRFNKAQQDALLGAVEDGTISLIGATTENPSFEVNAALLSRCRVVVLQPLETEEVATIVRRALDDPERGIAGQKPCLAPDLIEKLAGWSNGDARVALSTLEEAVEATLPAADGTRLGHRIDPGRGARYAPVMPMTGKEKTITTWLRP